MAGVSCSIMRIAKIWQYTFRDHITPYVVVLLDPAHMAEFLPERLYHEVNQVEVIQSLQKVTPMSRLPLGWLMGDRRLSDPVDAAAVSGLRRRLWLERTFFVIILALISALLYRHLYPSGRWAIVVDGRPAAIVPTRAVAEQVLDYTLRSKAGSLASQAKFRQAVGIEQAGPADGVAVDRWEAQQKLASKVSATVPACWIVADGRKLMALTDRKDAEAVLSEFVRHYIPKGSTLVGKPKFRERVTLLQQPVPAETAQEIIQTRKQALARLFEPSVSAMEYTVRPRDTASRIASRFKVSLADLKAANPDSNLEKLVVGKTINVAGGTAPISVTFRVKEQTSREIPFWTEYVPDQTMLPGEKKEIQKGTPGKQAINCIVTYINNKEVNRTEQVGRITLAPIPIRIAVGSSGKADDEVIAAAKALDDLDKSVRRHRRHTRPVPKEIE